jgi:hypothetical protein
MSIENVGNVEMIKSGDTFTSFELLLLNENGTAYDLNGKTVTVRLKGITEELIEKPGEVNSNGHVVFQITHEEFASIGFGTVLSEFVVTEGDDTAIFPNDGYFEFEVVRNSKQRSTIH